MLKSIFCFSLLATVVFCSPLYGNTYVVNTTNDTEAMDASNGSGLDVNGNISLRSALQTASAIGGDHTIILNSNTYTLTLGQIVIGTKPVNITLTGNGISNTIIDMTTGVTRDRILLLNPSGLENDVVLAVSGIKFQNGYLTSDHFGGAAITAGGGTGNSLSLTNCAFENNTVPEFYGTGGAINQVISGDLTITNCSFINNHDEDADGGAVYFYIQGPGFGEPAFTGNLFISGSTFSGNTTSNNASGGALAVSASGTGLTPFTVSIQKNTFINNIAAGNGGAIAINSSYGAAADVNVNYNRFSGNNSSNNSTSGLAVFDGGGNVNAVNNWWGCNTGPDANGNCDRAAVVGFISLGSLTTAPWLQLKASADPDKFCSGGQGNQSTVTASFFSNSANEPVSLSDLAVLIGLPVSFVNIQNGTLSLAQETIQSNGEATALFTSNGAGDGEVHVVVDLVDPNDQVAKVTVRSDDGDPLITCPQPITVQCPGDVPPADPSTVNATDNAGIPVVTFVGDVVSNQTCPNSYTITRTYMATDACGNSSTCNQIITVNDETPPTITCPPNVVVHCASAIPPHDFAGGTSGDNCGAVTVTWEGDQITSQTDANNFTTSRTYRATDACGNYTECTQTIVVDDDVEATITCPASLTVSCASQVPPADFAGGIAFDNCGNVPVSWGGDVISGQECDNRYMITRTYIATDNQGNHISCTQIITVKDEIPPQIICSNLEVNPESLAGAVVDYPVPTAMDNCGAVTLTRISGAAPGSIFPIGSSTVTYQATDPCGNFSLCTFTITVRNPACGNNGNKIYVCHNGHSICVSESAVNSHLAHGDLLGPCSWYSFARSQTGEENEAGTGSDGDEDETADQKSKASQKLPETFKVSAFPNPVTSEAKIFYELPQDCRITIGLFDLTGKLVGRLVSGERKAGVYSETIRVQQLTAGIYYYKFTASFNNKIVISNGKLSVIH